MGHAKHQERDSPLLTLYSHSSEVVLELAGRDFVRDDTKVIKCLLGWFEHTTDVVPLWLSENDCRMG